MKLQEALSKIPAAFFVHSPKGVTSVIAGFMSGDFKPIRDQNAMGSSLEHAKAELKQYTDAQNNAGSDWAYWGYAGDVAYWSCVVSLLEAAELVGPDNLPDVAAPSTEGVVMDVQWNIRHFGQQVLEEAKKASAIRIP